jgi:hypothetical protein
LKHSGIRRNEDSVFRPQRMPVRLSANSSSRPLRTMRAMTTWFCDAYASWQKGGVENANDLRNRSPTVPAQLNCRQTASEAAFASTPSSSEACSQVGRHGCADTNRPFDEASASSPTRAQSSNSANRGWPTFIDGETMYPRRGCSKRSTWRSNTARSRPLARRGCSTSA